MWRICFDPPIDERSDKRLCTIDDHLICHKMCFYAMTDDLASILLFIYGKNVHKSDMNGTFSLSASMARYLRLRDSS